MGILHIWCIIHEILVFSIFVLTVHVAPQDGDTRLMTGDRITFHFGRVEVYYTGQWGTVCHDQWDLNDAKVVCQQLGYSRAVSAPKSATFGKGTGPIHFDNVQCNGDEAHIAVCSHRGIGISNCDHNEDAGVVCEGTPAIGQLSLCSYVCM